MKFTGFKNEDFEVFSIDGFDERMNAIKEQIRPKLSELGTYFSQSLSVQLGEEIFPHVAKHARRTVNPPKDTWVAFSDNPRGYKMRPHFQIGLWETHLFIWFAIIYEAPNKEQYAKRIMEQFECLYNETKQDFVWSGDHTKPDVYRHSELTKEDLLRLFQRFESVKKGELLCGYQIPREKATTLSGEEFIKTTEEVFKDLLALYRITLDIVPAETKK